MKRPPPVGGRLRRLKVSLALVWAMAFCSGLAAIALVAARLNAELHTRDLDAELAYVAMATYGLTYFDQQGRFHDELFRREPEIIESPYDIWLLEAASPPSTSPGRRHLSPVSPRFVVDFSDLVEQVVSTREDIIRDGFDVSGRRLRVHAVPAFRDQGDEPIGAIIVVGDPEPGVLAHRDFVRGLVISVVVLGAVGIALGLALAAWTLRPVAESFRQRERFLTATAHEMRTPVATLRGICESARAGDESAERALERIAPLVERTGVVVEDLLLFARLDAGTAPLECQPVRLDLLVETVLPDRVDFRLEEANDEGGSVVEADPRLLTVAVRNLVENACRHGGPREEDVRVTVGRSQVRVEDRGEGLPVDVVEALRRGAAPVPSRRGAGIGLSIAWMIAQLHGGELQLENPADGGGRVTLCLAGNTVSGG